MKNLLTSLAAFQQECPIIRKETKGYGYKYADLPTVLETIMPLLKKHGLMFIQGLDSNGAHRYVTTTVFHIETGEKIDSKIDIPSVKFKGMNDYQALGSGITYLRRYALSAILGIVSDEDNDAPGMQGGDATPYQISNIESLLSTSTLPEPDKVRIENQLIDLTFTRAEKCIAYLKENQRLPLENDVIKQKDINKQLDIIENDPKK